MVSLKVYNVKEFYAQRASALHRFNEKKTFRLILIAIVIVKVLTFQKRRLSERSGRIETRHYNKVHNYENRFKLKTFKGNFLLCAFFMRKAVLSIGS